MQDWNPAANEIFAEAVSIEGETERAEFVAYQCGKDERLKAEVQSLLQAFEADPSFLSQGLIERPDDTTAAANLATLGSMIGPYKLLQQIGEGGFGVVYMAEQKRPVRRKVALKIVKPGMDTKEVIARFKAEQQALALMNHPNIARVMDAGTTKTGRPYFVMELVKGVPITEFCDENKLSTRDRLELLETVCKAVQHAHQKGVIHRDLKPSNVMVTLDDEVPVPKIIDFGVAKAINQELTERTLFTAYGQMVGTPQYMSPEQAKISAIDVDTRSDVYSLGVVMYELLTDSTPLGADRLRKSGFDEMRRLIREEEPPLPSTRLSSLSQRISSIADNRGTDPSSLQQSVRGELDWIVMKALDKDRKRRYQSASDLAADLRRYLGGDAVEACPPSWRYRAVKFTRRYRVQVAAAGTLFGVLAVSTVVAFLLWLRAEDARDKEAVARRESDALRGEVEESLQLSETLRVEAEDYSGQLRRSRYNAKVALAANAFAKQDRYQTIDLLAECESEYRGWEWHYLDAQTRPDHTTTFPFTLQQMGVHPDGRRVAIVDEQNRLGVYDARDGEALWSRSIDIRTPGAPKFSPDGRLLCVSSGRDIGDVLLVNAVDGATVREIRRNASLSSVQFSPDSQFFAFGVFDWAKDRGSRGALEYWSVGENRPIWQLPMGALALPTFSANGKRLFVDVSIGPVGPSVLQCWELEGPKKLWEEECEGTSFATPLPTSPDRILTGTEHQLELRDAGSGDIVETHTDAGFGRGGFSPSGQFFWAVNSVDRLSVRKAASRALVWDLGVGSTWNGGAGFSEDERHLMVASGRSKQLDFLRLEPPSAARDLNGPERYMRQACFAPCGDRILGISYQSAVQEWDARTGKFVGHLPTRERGYGYVIRVSPGGEFVAVGGPEGMRIYRRNTRELYLDSPHKGWVIDFSRDGNRVASGTYRLQVWDLERRKILRSSLKVDGLVSAATFLDDAGRRVAFGSSVGTSLYVWDVDAGERFQLVRSSSESESFNSLSRRPGTSVVAAAVGDYIEIWDLANEQRLHRVRAHVGEVKALVYHPDGSRIFSMGYYNDVKVWDAATGTELLTLRSRQLKKANYGNLAISPNGRTLIAQGGQGVTMQMWTLDRPSLELDQQRRKIAAANDRVRQTLHDVGMKDLANQRAALRELMADENLEPETGKIVREFANLLLENMRQPKVQDAPDADAADGEPSP